MPTQFTLILIFFGLIACYLFAETIKTVFEVVGKLITMVAVCFAAFFFFNSENWNFWKTTLPPLETFELEKFPELSEKDLIRANFQLADEESTNQNSLVTPQTYEQALTTIVPANNSKIIVEHHVYFKNEPQQTIDIAANHLGLATPIVGQNNQTAVKGKHTLMVAYCNQFEIPENRYILIESFYEEEQNAQNRVEWLKSKGFDQVKYIWLPCFQSEKNQELYAVVLGRTCRMESTILDKQQTYWNKAAKKDIELISNVPLYIEGKYY